MVTYTTIRWHEPWWPIEIHPIRILASHQWKCCMVEQITTPYFTRTTRFIDVRGKRRSREKGRWWKDTNWINMNSRPFRGLQAGESEQVQNQVRQYPRRWTKTGRVVETVGNKQYCIRLDGRGHLWWCNGLQARQTNLHEWVRVSLGAPFIRSCATSKQRAS